MTNNTIPYLQQEYKSQKALFESQPTIVQRFLEGQAQSIADALIEKRASVRFSLPDRVITHLSQVGQMGAILVPVAARQIRMGVFLPRDLREVLLRRLNELEKSVDQAIAVSAGLLRYATASYMVNDLLPAGRAVSYRPNDDESIPTLPVEDNAPESAITQASDAILEGRYRLHSSRRRGSSSCRNGSPSIQRENCLLDPSGKPRLISNRCSAM